MIPNQLDYQKLLPHRFPIDPWCPAMEGSCRHARCAFTRVPYGTDVDFGELTKEKPRVTVGGFCGQLLGVELMDSM